MDGIPFLYRVHEEPKTEDVIEVNKFLQALGYSIKGAGNTIHPKGLSVYCRGSSRTSERTTCQYCLLRSMQHARYDTEALGHFGLSTVLFAFYIAYSPLSGFGYPSCDKKNYCIMEISWMKNGWLF